MFCGKVKNGWNHIANHCGDVEVGKGGVRRSQREDFQFGDS